MSVIDPYLPNLEERLLACYIFFFYCLHVLLWPANTITVKFAELGYRYLKSHKRWKLTCWCWARNFNSKLQIVVVTASVSWESISREIDFPIGPFTILESQKLEINGFHRAQESRARDFEAPKLWKGRSCWKVPKPGNPARASEVLASHAAGRFPKTHSGKINSYRLDSAYSRRG